MSVFVCVYLDSTGQTPIFRLSIVSFATQMAEKVDLSLTVSYLVAFKKLYARPF